MAVLGQLLLVLNLRLEERRVVFLILVLGDQVLAPDGVCHVGVWALVFFFGDGLGGRMPVREIDDHLLDLRLLQRRRVGIGALETLLVGEEALLAVEAD